MFKNFLWIISFITIFFLIFTPGAGAATISLADGWNLVSSRVAINISDAFSDDSKFVSVWKWVNNTWAVYVPGQNTLSYAEAKGFKIISSILPGEGFWVSCIGKQNISVTGTESSSDAMSFSTGWNLKGLTKSEPINVPAVFEDSIKFASVWKWKGNNWYVFLPGGGTEEYANSKGFNVLEEINPGEGFWVNYKGKGMKTPPKPMTKYPIRLAQGPKGKIYVSDAMAGLVFIYDAGLNLIGELKNLDLPLGIAVDDKGNIYVGNNGRDNVEIYSADSVKLLVIDDGNIKMPNDMALDNEGDLYVADSLSNMVKVYDATGQWLRNIGGPGDGEGGLRFPVAVTIAYRQGNGELYVADQGHARVQVFDLDGNFLRAYGSAVAAFSMDWQGKFVKIQSLAVDSLGRLHAADSYMNKVQILDADTGDYLDSYGTFGTDPGQLNLPLDIIITQSGHVVVTNAGNRRVEIIYAIQ